MASLKSVNKTQSYDVVIMGAGINGAGLFRDLSLQGINCLIIDKNDFSAGASAAPSRLIHGGLKYIETAELGLVAQSAFERNLLLKNAPHYVAQLPTVIPVFSWLKGIIPALKTLFGSVSSPRSRGAILIKIGLMMYDFYGSKEKVMPNHTMRFGNTAIKDLPVLNKNTVATGTYYDAKISHPERLVWELIQDGMNANKNSAAHNYASVQSVTDGKLSIHLEHTNQTITVKPKIVVNAGGPWIDRINEVLGETTQMIGGTKGSHMVIKHDALVKHLNGRMIYFEANDGRICLVFEYLGHALIGATDISADNPDDVMCEDWEIDYFLESMRSLLPDLTFERSQIIYTYSGIRPLPKMDVGNVGLISRDHSAPLLEATKNRPFDIISLVGGKWTTFRGFAEEVSHTILQRLNAPHRKSTKFIPIGGGKNYPTDGDARKTWLQKAHQETGIAIDVIDILLSRYGTHALSVLSHNSPYQADDWLIDTQDYSTLEIDYIAHHEQVESVLDVVMRRTTMAIEGKLSLNSIKQIAEIVGKAKGWKPARIKSEITQTSTTLKNTNQVRL